MALMDRDGWYHVGHPADPEEAAERRAHGLPVYEPTDPRSIDQTPYIEFASRDRTPEYQKEHAR